MFEQLADWLDSNKQECFIRKYAGIDCPGCGMQRALIELLHGNIIESIALYPALIRTPVMFIYLILHLKLKFRNGSIVLKIMFITNLVLIFVNWGLKLLSN